MKTTVSALLMLVSTCLSAVAEIKPLFEKATLEVGGQVLIPMEIVKSWRTIHHVGESCFCVASNTATKMGIGSVWKAKSDNGNYLHWLAAGDTTAYLVGYKVDTNQQFRGYESPPRIRRLNLRTGKWLSDLPVASGKSDLSQANGVVSILPGEDEVVVLTSFGQGKRDKEGEETTDAYEVRLFRGGSDKPVWSKRLPAAGERQYTGGYLWGIPPPQYAGSAIQHLSWMDDRLLVLPEAMQPIYCLNPDTGSEIWQVDRLWEFQRGFIGPSVWSHYISRFGIAEFGAKKRNVADVRKEFDKQFTCALVAGPVPIHLNFERECDTHSIFVAVVKGPAEGWAGYLSDCLVYELDDSGKPISVATLPQAVKGSPSFVQEDGVVWRCQNDTFVKVAPSPSAPVIEMGGGGSDGILHVSWLRQLQYKEPEARVVTARAGDPVAFSDTHAFCLPGGGYITPSEDHIYRFPIAAIDLSSGRDSTPILSIPFEGLFPVPESNYSTIALRDGTSGYRTLMHHELAITHLSAYGRELEITLAMEKRAVSLRFDLGEVMARTTRQQPQPFADPMDAARARVKALPHDSLNDVLSSAAHGRDAAFVRALLEAGADPGAASRNGWTALMTAATYGSAEMVDMLIEAGSDVNAKDNNCGGQSVLIWAARSASQSKKKVESLLKAGADLNAVSDDGYDALMMAAGGRLPTVECLLEKGMKVSNKDKEGRTVLMFAAGSGQAGMVSALLKAGADVKARDDKGMTPLMHAAEGAENAGAVKVLLESGADPNATDKRDRTALQIAKSSRSMGSDEIVEILEAVTKGEHGDK